MDYEATSIVASQTLLFIEFYLVYQGQL
jgi:hypothetical protein